MLENHPIFPERANISIAHVTARDAITIRTWERGAGLTRACGSAACAVAVSAARTKRTGRTVTVTVPGGPLRIEWRDDDHVIMTGPAEWEFSGTLRSGVGQLGARHRKRRLMPDSGKGVEIVTFGCRLNTYESEVMRREATPPAWAS